jgi:geranylgeranyl diphosphate synthase type II
MYSYSQCFDIIERELSQISLANKPKELFEPIRYALSIGGKRIRPCLALMAHSLFSDTIETVIKPAMGLEVFHNFTLLHDDIMDKAELRRNHQTVHMKWNQNTAILSGDAMMILAYDLISDTAVKVLPDILTLFGQTALEVCEGQQLDMNFERSEYISEAEYLEMIRLKTAVLLGASMALGGITGGTSKENIDRLYNVGLYTGMAFQLQDDYMDVFANEKSFGKKIGGDIHANKKTYLMISALNSSDQQQIDLLKTWLRKEDFTSEEKIKAVTQIYLKLEVDKKCRELAGKYFNMGIDQLSQLTIEQTRIAELKSFLLSIKDRKR